MSEGYVPIISIDFDGVLHSHPKWEGDTVLHAPVKGASEFTHSLKQLNKYKIIICSTRAKTYDGRQAMIHWCIEHNIYYDEITTEKVPAIVHIDDRVIPFNGSFEHLTERIINFKPWNRIKKTEIDNQIDIYSYFGIDIYKEFEEPDKPLFDDNGDGTLTVQKEDTFKRDRMKLWKVYNGFTACCPIHVLVIAKDATQAVKKALIQFEKEFGKNHVNPSASVELVCDDLTKEFISEIEGD